MGEKENGRKGVIGTAKQTRQRPIKIQLLPLNSPSLRCRSSVITWWFRTQGGLSSRRPLKDSLATPSVLIIRTPTHCLSLLHHLPQASHPDPQSLEKTPGQRWTRGSWMGPGLAFVWPYCRVPLFTQSLTLYVFLSLNCIGLCCPLVNQYHLSNDISNSIQRGLTRWWVFRGRAGGNEPCKCRPTALFPSITEPVYTYIYLSTKPCLSMYPNHIATYNICMYSMMVSYYLYTTLCLFVNSQMVHSCGHVFFCGGGWVFFSFRLSTLESIGELTAS